MKYLTSLVVFAVFAQSVSAGQVADLCRSIGLTPETLAGAGCNSVDTHTVLQHLNDATEGRGALTAAKARLEEALSAHSAVTRQLQDSPGDALLRAAFDAAKANLLDARHAIDIAKEHLRSDSLAGISIAKVARVQRLIDRSRSSAPVAFRVFVCENSQFELIERAFAAEARANRTSTPLSQAQVDLLTSVRTDSDVQAATANFEEVGAIRSAFSGY